jgi:predicted ATP-grasp superfamily ATP-dependent carboligase
VEHVLLAGLSTRAAAGSAAQAGFTVTALDAFADIDQHPAVQAIALTNAAGRFTAPAAARVAAALPGTAVAYLSPFENHPRAVRQLAAGRALLGNPPDVLRVVRDPVAVAAAFARHGFAVPRVARERAAASRDIRWMLKPLASGGGSRIGDWRGREVPRRGYLQERIDGIAGSIAFVAAGGHAVPLVISLLLAGEAAFGATGHRYCGSVRLAPGDVFAERTHAIARDLASCAARTFGLVGVNGIDFIVRDGLPYPIEINPRWSASMELADRHGAVFAAHAAACRHGVLPPPAAFDLLPGAPALAKAVVFARRDSVAGDTAAWREGGWRRDIPRPGVPIAAGQPVCTVLAEGVDARHARNALARRAAEVYGALA